LGCDLKVKTRRTYPFRAFYNNRKRRVAFYIIEPIGEEPSIIIYSDYLRDKSLSLKKSQLENDAFNSRRLLERHFPQELADAIFKFARKDLGCKAGFSLESYVKWRESQT